MNTTKKLAIVLFLSILVACSGQEISNNILLDANELLGSNSDVNRLNNLANSFGDYLYVNSMYANFVFWDKDVNGTYNSWVMPRELFPNILRIYNIFNYTDKIVCICKNEEGNDEIIIYNMDISIQKRKEINSFIPRYLYNDLLYGFNHYSDSRPSTITTINLDSLESEELYSYDSSENISFIISNIGEVVVAENLGESITQYSKCENGKLFPVMKTKSSYPILYDSRGMFYLENNNTTSEMNLMLWDGDKSIKIKSIRVDDMDQWTFKDGISGNVIIFGESFISIHCNTEEPYLLIQEFDSTDSQRILLKKWDFTEADIERNGETFSGIYYENGQIINYFFSKTSGILQTQTFDVRQ